ncbi:hypothetical protein AAHA92_26740 [Salvia divinorum]|uniref:Uncharacterized protein n=1 Tax=Salvia divinorum TaxID=28513 RepID=A0ABD1G1J2_SALDI
MDPQYEQRLRDEVLFLHSLWHQGPPTTAATPYHLQPSKSTHFKKKPNHRAKTRPNAASSTSSHGVEWPCPASPPPAITWPTGPAPTPNPPPLSPEEQAKLAAKGALHHALKAVRESLTSSSPDDSDEIESSDDDDEPMDGNCGSEVYSVFNIVFEDATLKEYYAKNFVMGEFSCLVCGAVGGKNSGKKFKGCLPLLQHSISIEKTKRKGAHRAFAQAVCEVLGWDIHRLPEIVSKLSDKSGEQQQVESSLALAHNADSVNDDASDGKDIGVVHALLDTEEPALDGLTSGNGGDGDKVEIPVALAHNVDSVKDDDLGGKDGMAEPAPNACEDIGSVHTLPGTEEPASDGLTSCFSACHDALAATVSPSTAVPMVSQPSEAKWSCAGPPGPLPSTGWVTLEKSSVKAQLPSIEEQSIQSSRNVHQRALKVVHELFLTNKSDGDDDDDDQMEEDGGGEMYSCFFKVFEENTDLRDYYAKNFSKGEFSCLVCGALGGKGSMKKFKGCLPLVQHSITIAKTKKRKPHRAFARAVCKVLGWDIDSLNDIASLLSDKTGKI